MTFDDVLGVATLVFCVAAVLLARRGARRKLQAAYAQGARDVSARSSVAVHVGDTFGNVGSLINEADGSALDNRPALDHGTAGTVHAARATVRRAGDGRGVLDVSHDGTDGTIGELRSGVPVDPGHSRRRGDRLDGSASPVDVWSAEL